MDDICKGNSDTPLIKLDSDFTEFECPGALRKSIRAEHLYVFQYHLMMSVILGFITYGLVVELHILWKALCFNSTQ